MATPPNNFGPGGPTPYNTILSIAVNMQDDADVFGLMASNPSIIGDYNRLFDQGKVPPKIHNFTGKNYLGIRGIVEVPVGSAPHPVFTGKLSIQQINAINSGQDPSTVITPTHAGLILPSTNTPQSNQVGRPLAPGWTNGVAPNPQIISPSPSGQNTNTGSASANPYSVSSVAGSGTQYPVSTVNAGVQSLLSAFGSNPVVLIGIATALFLMFGGGGGGGSRE